MKERPIHGCVRFFFNNKNVYFGAQKMWDYFTTVGGKKGPILNWSTSVNFWDITTLLRNADTLKKRIFPGKFDGTILKVRQLLVDTHMAQNPKMTKKFCSFLYPRGFFLQVWYVPHTISTSNIYFGLRLLIPVILSCIAAGYDHFRPFYQNLKNGHF